MIKRNARKSLKHLNGPMPERPKSSTFERVLTRRELEICDMLAKGYSNAEIAGFVFITEGTVKNHISSIYEKVGVSNRVQLVSKYIAEHASVVTEMSEIHADALQNAQANAMLRLVGAEGLPAYISLTLSEQPYVIGRYDISVGRKQCDFEFDHGTKEVSRRHAAISISSYGCVIMDLNSRAGTYINGEKLTANKYFRISDGDRVSFGNAGADYQFESGDIKVS